MQFSTEGIIVLFLEILYSIFFYDLTDIRPLVVIKLYFHKK